MLRVITSLKKEMEQMNVDREAVINVATLNFALPSKMQTGSKSRPSRSKS